MNRVPGYLLAAAVGLASMGASPPPPDGHDQQASLKTAAVSSNTRKVTARQKRDRRPFQVGTASWYGRYFHGRQTASGEPYDMFALTAAHRTLKLGTWVRVTNLRNGKSVLVRINDRGPVPQSRIIDLSFEAATMLDFRARGLERVRVDVVEPETVALALKLRSLP